MTASTLRPPLLLEAQPVIATRLLAAFTDGTLSAGEVARLVEADGALSIRVIRLANAPYYGAAGQVASAARAVLLLGLSTVRGLVATSTWSLLQDSAAVPPPGYLTQSLVAAAATSAVAHKVGAFAQESYTLGILHDVGRLTAEEDDDDDHAAAGAALLAASRFPARFVQAVRQHHLEPEAVTEPMARVLIAGLAVAATIFPPPTGSPSDPAQALEAVGLRAHHGARLANAAMQDIESRAALLGMTW